MANVFKGLFALIVIPLILLLTGCNSEGAFSESPHNIAKAAHAAPVLVEIIVLPSPVDVQKGQTQQLRAIAVYSDNTTYDVTDSVTWASLDNDIATVSDDGLLSGIKEGDTTLTATIGSITSDFVSVETTCANLAGPCIDIVEVGGKLFTSTPSVPYLTSIGGSTNNGSYTGKGTYATKGGKFHLFTWSKAKALCDTYNTIQLGSRSNWTLASSNELKNELFNAYGNMYNALGWPVQVGAFSSTPNGSSVYGVGLGTGTLRTTSKNNDGTATCVSHL